MEINKNKNIQDLIEFGKTHKIKFAIGFIVTISIYFLFFDTLSKEEMNQKIQQKVKENQLEIKKIEKVKEGIDKELKEKTKKIFDDLKQSCAIEKYSNINTVENCNKNEIEEYVKNKTGYNALTLGLTDYLNQMEWYKKDTKDFTQKDYKELPSGSTVQEGIVMHKYTGVKDLYYGIHINDKPYVTQDMLTHYKNNLRLATDVGVSNLQRYVYTPDWKNTEIKYTVKRVKSFDYGDGVELHFTVNGAHYKWLYGHVTLSDKIKDGDTVKTGDVIGKLNLTGITTGYHLHLELWQDDNQVLYSIKPKVIEERNEKNKKLGIK